MAGSANKKDIFLKALDLPSHAERASFLAQACGSDEALRQQVETMLRAHAVPDSFLEKPAALLGVTVDSSDGIPSTDNAFREGPGTRIGPYKLLEQIGEGGMGVVFMAEQQEPVRRMVALKIIKPGMDSAQVLARFEAERQALALMDHPNIAKVLDASATADGRPFFVMELVKGTPITTFCDANKLSPRQRLELFVPVCQAIQHAHQKGVIHRDIKPSNVLIALYDDKPVPKVIDFGIAKATGNPLTERTLHTGFGAIVGTPEYMSPEQATFNQLDIDTRSDVYSLGVLLYELLTGTTPVDKTRIKEAAILEVLRVVREEEPARPSIKLSTTAARASIAATRNTDPAKLAQMLRGELDWIVMKSLEKDRSRRYETAAGFGRDVDRYLKDELVEARPPTAGYRLRKFLRRQRGPVLAASLVLVALVAGVIGTTMGMFRALEAEREMLVWYDQAERKTVEAVLEQGKAVLSAEEARESERKTKTALTHNEGMRLLYQSEFTRPNNPALALLLGIEGAERHPGLLANNTLLAALDANREERTLPGGGPLCYSADGRQLLTTVAARICLSDAQTGKQVIQFEKQLVTFKEDGDGKLWPESYGAAFFHPDGKQVLTTSEQGRACLWDAVTGKVLARLEDAEDAANKKSERAFHSPARFSPDGRFVLTANGRARIWDVASRKQLLVLQGHEKRVNWAEFSRDGKKIITASSDKTARIWDAESGKQLHALELPSYIVLTASFSPDGQRALTTVLFPDINGEASCRLWDVATGKEIAAIGSPNGTSAPLAQFSPDGRYVCAVVGPDGVGAPKAEGLSFWDATTGKHLHRLRDFYYGSTPAFSPDGSLLMTAGHLPRDGKGIQLWDPKTFQIVESLLGQNGGPNAVFSPDGEQLATRGSGGVHLWVVAGAAKRRLGHWSQFKFLAVSSDGCALATRTLDPKEVAVWDITTGREIARFQGKDCSEIRFARFSLDGRRIIFGGRPHPKSESAYVGDIATSQLTAILPGHRVPYYEAHLSPDSRWAVTVDVYASRFKDSKYQGRIWNLATGKEHAGWTIREDGDGQTGDGESDRDIRYSPDGRWLVIPQLMGGRNNLIAARLRDALTGAQVAVLKPAYVGRLGLGESSAIFSRDSQRLVTWYGSQSGGGAAAHVWDTATGKELAGLKVEIDDKTSYVEPVLIRKATFSHDGKWIVTRCTQGISLQTVRVWETATGKEILVLRDHEDQVTDVAINPDKTMIVTADKAVRLWNAQTGELLAVFHGHLDHVRSAQFLPDGRVLSVDTTGVARVWPTDPLSAARARAPRDLTPTERKQYEVPTAAQR